MIAFFTKIRLLYCILLHKEAPLSVKLFLLAGFFYLIFPLDIIPDYIFLAGWIDDLILAILSFSLAVKYTPEELVGRILKKIKDGKKDDE